MNWRRILLIIGLLLAVIVIGALLYFMFLAPAPVTPPIAPPTPTPPAPVTGLPPSGQAPPAVNAPTPPLVNAPPTPPAGPSPVARGGVTQSTFVTSQPVTAPTIASDRRSVNYYDNNSRQFFRLTPDGPALLSSTVFPDVTNVTWSPTNDEAIIEFPDGANILYDFNNQSQVSLPRHWQNFEFLPNRPDQIAFKSIGTDPENRWLAVSTATGDEVTIISALGNNNRVIVNPSPNNQMVGMYTENISADRSELFFIGYNDENFKSTTLEGQGFVGQWTPNGDKIMYSVYSNATDNKPSLWIVDTLGNDIGNNKKPIGLQTWADKCTFSQDNVTAYCAAPQGLPEGAGIFRPATADLPDAFYRVNTITGVYELIAVPNQHVSAQNLILSTDQGTLYFVDSNTNLLANIRLQ